MLKRILLLGAVSLFLTACLRVTTDGGGPSGTAGLWRSDDQGNKFQPIVNLLSSDGKVRTIGAVSVWTMVFDPADSQTVYVGTEGHGVFTSNNKGEGWQQILNSRQGPVRTVAVDPKYRCTIYAAAENRIYKTVDCGKVWSQIYVDSRADAIIKTLNVASDGSHLVLAGLSTGDLQLSRDYGVRWSNIKRFDDFITSASFTASGRIIVGFRNRGYAITVDGGQTWEEVGNLSQELATLGDQNRNCGSTVLGFQAVGNEVTLATTRCLVRGQAVNGRIAWSGQASLLSPSTETSITAFGVNPRNSNELYYATPTTFNSSKDGGKSWKNSNLPTRRAVRTIMVDPVNSQTIYLGFAN